ncbi:MAG: hypothetical protein JXQ71_03315 [Verrucomicrobia bacterium]|nr:hypothetical protein [Verrucomicrobiota bacterium]
MIRLTVGGAEGGGRLRESGGTGGGPEVSSAGWALALPQAVAFCGKQLEELDRARAVLLGMTRLAHRAVSQRADATVATGYRRSATRFQRLAAGVVDLIPLFDGATLAVNLGADGNQLVMAGINLGAPHYQGCIEAALHEPFGSTRLVRKISLALRQLAADESVVRANVERLQICLLESRKPSAAGAGSVGRSDGPDEGATDETQWHLFGARAGEAAVASSRGASRS